MTQITHSGQTFTSLGVKDGMWVWPIKEYLARRRHGQNVAERIERLNPNGKAEGEWPRGWYPHPRSDNYAYDCLTVSQFIQKVGREKYREPPRAAITHDGKRKRISRLYVVSHL